MRTYHTSTCYLDDVSTVDAKFANVAHDRGCQAGGRHGGQGGLQLRFQACDGAIDAGDLTEGPALDAVVPAEALESSRRDPQHLFNGLVGGVDGQTERRAKHHGRQRR